MQGRTSILSRCRKLHSEISGRMARFTVVVAEGATQGHELTRLLIWALVLLHDLHHSREKYLILLVAHLQKE